MKKTFIFTDGAEHDASVAEESQAFEISYNYLFVIAPINTAVVGGPPNYTVQVSIDNVNFYDLAPEATDLSSASPYVDENLAWCFIKIKHEPNGSTEGKTIYNINLKKK